MDNDVKAARMVKGRLEKTTLGQVARHIKIVLKPGRTAADPTGGADGGSGAYGGGPRLHGEAAISIRLDMATIDALQLDVDGHTVRGYYYILYGKYHIWHIVYTVRCSTAAGRGRTHGACVLFYYTMKCIFVFYAVDGHTVGGTWEGEEGGAWGERAGRDQGGRGREGEGQGNRRAGWGRHDRAPWWGLRPGCPGCAALRHGGRVPAAVLCRPWDPAALLQLGSSMPIFAPSPTAARPQGAHAWPHPHAQPTPTPPLQVKYSILSNAKLKLKEQHVRAVAQDKVLVYPPDASRQGLLFCLESLLGKLPKVRVRADG